MAISYKKIVLFSWMNAVETTILSGFLQKNGLGTLGVNNIL